MKNDLVNQILIEKGISNAKIYYDVDGPGVGNSAIVERELRPKEGGIYVWFYYYKYPYKGNPVREVVDRLHVAKKIIYFAFRAFNNRPCKVAVGLLYILPRRWTKGLIESVASFFFTTIEWILYPCLIKPDKYCVSVREMYRAFTVVSFGQKNPLSARAINIMRDIVCLFLEIDNAYRFRVQDAMPHVIRWELQAKSKDRVINELKKLFGIVISREVGTKTMANKWILLRDAICQILEKIKPARDIFQQFIRELDFNLLEPDNADIYFNAFRNDYDFEGKSLQERIERRKVAEGENWRYFKDLADGFLEEYIRVKEAMKNG